MFILTICAIIALMIVFYPTLIGFRISAKYIKDNYSDTINNCINWFETLKWCPPGGT